MKKYENMTELMTADVFIYLTYKDILKSLSEEDFEGLFSEPFQNTLGGDIFIIESKEDLKQIQTGGLSEEESTLFDKPDIFDVCEWNGEYVLVWYATNNSGGPSFWIPKEIALNNKNVMASLSLQHGEKL